MHAISELRERYLRLRQVSTALHGTMIKGFSKDEVQRAAKDLGMLRNGTLVLGSMDESAVLFDYCIYNLYRDGRNAVERFMEECPPTEGSVERLVLEAKCRAWYSVFGMEKIVPGVGVEVSDILRGERHLMADLGLSQSDCVGGLLGTRAIPFDGFIMTGGAGLPLSGDEETREAFLGDFQRVCFDQNITAFKQLTREQEKAVTRTIIRVALAKRMSSSVRYEDPEPIRAAPRQRRQPALVTTGTRVGRNDPCPCGSGKKFKLCCRRSR